MATTIATKYAPMLHVAAPAPTDSAMVRKNVATSAGGIGARDVGVSLRGVVAVHTSACDAQQRAQAGM